MRQLAAALAGVMLWGGGVGCRDLLPAVGIDGDGREQFLPLRRIWFDSAGRTNRRRDELAAVICVFSRYPWYMADLTPWRDSVPLLRQSMRLTLGIPAENIRTYTDPDVGDLDAVLGRCALEFADKRVLFYLAAHLRKNGRLLLSGGRSFPMEKLIRRVNATPNIRILILDTCFAGSAERYGPFRKNLIRWYAAGEGRPAQAFDRGFRSKQAERFFSQALGTKEARIDNRSFFALILAGALRNAVCRTGAERVTAASVGEELRNLAVEFRRQTRITRVPVPVCVGEAAGSLVLYESVLRPVSR